MMFCNAHGIPHSVFLSWDQEDRDKAIAFERLQRELCATCKTRAAEWKEDRFAYIAEVERCPGCEVLDQENDNVRNMTEESKDNSLAYGLKIRLRKNYPGLEPTAEEIFR